MDDQIVFYARKTRDGRWRVSVVPSTMSDYHLITGDTLTVEIGDVEFYIECKSKEKK